MNRQWDYDDLLRAQFTKWLDRVIYHAKLKYLRKEMERPDMVSVEALPESRHPSYEELWDYPSQKMVFDFEEERLADAFGNLSEKQKQILIMLYVEERKPEEISRILDCPVRHVYNQRYQILKKLRWELEKGGDIR